MATHGRQMRELASLQKKVTVGRIADERRRELIIELHREGVTQVELAAKLTTASETVGGPPVGLDSVQKIYARYGRNGNGRHQPGV